MKSFKKLPTIPNVSAGNGVTVTLPVGNTYEHVVLYYKGVTPKQFKNIRLELNGRLISEYKDGERLQSMDKHYDRAQTDGALTFHFNRPELHVLGERRFFGLDTNKSQGIISAVIRIDVDKDAAAPELEAFAEVVQSVPGAPNFLTKVRNYYVPVSSQGTFEIDNINMPAGATIAAFHLYMPIPDAKKDEAGARCPITKAELLTDNTNWHDIDAIKAGNRQASNGRVPQIKDSTVIDLIQDGDIRNALVFETIVNGKVVGKIQDMRLRCEADSTGQVAVAVEYIDKWTLGGF